MSLRVLSIRGLEHPSIDVYPNPSNDGVFTLNLSGNTVMEIYNVLGAEVYKSSVIGMGSSVVDLSSQPNGIYVLKMKTEEGIAVRKIIKE